MSYTKQEFKSGEKLYAAQLNAMDEQIAKNAEDAEGISREIADFREDAAVTSDIVTKLFDSNRDAWVNKIVTPEGIIADNATVFATPLIDFAEHESITVRINDYNDNGNNISSHDIWVSQYDENMQYIPDSRKKFMLHPINEDRNVYEGYSTSDLSYIQTKTYVQNKPVSYAFGGQNTVVQADGAKYFMLFNFKVGATVDMEVFTAHGNTVHKTVIPQEKLAIGERFDSVEKAVFGDGQIVFDSSVDAFKHGLVGGNGAVFDEDKKYRLPLIEITDVPLTVRVSAYNSNGVASEHDSHNIWIALYDENYSFVSGSRAEFKMHSVNDPTQITANLLAMGANIGNGWEGEITPTEGAKYAIIFNFFNGTTLSISVVKGANGRVGVIKKVEALESKVDSLSESKADVTTPFIGEANIPLITTVFGSTAIHNTDFAAVAVTDLHGKFISLDDANLIRSTYAPAAPIFNLGDMINLRAKTDGVINAEVSEYMEKAVRYGVYHTMGQHETGWSNVNVDNPANKGYLKTNCMTHEEVFQYFIEPMKEVWGLPDLTTNYYYKDFDGMRLISLYQYNIPLYEDPNDSTMYKYLRCSVWLGQEQLDWLINTLNSTPSGSKVIILMHQSETYIVDSGDNNNFFTMQVGGGNNIIQGTPVTDIVQAFIDRTTINKTYTCADTEKYSESDFTVVVNGDFTSAQGEFANYITGDSHVDSVGFIKDTKQRAMGLTSSSSSYDCIVKPKWGNEARRIVSLLGYCYDNDCVKLGRIGQQYAVNGQHRILDKIEY